MGLGCGVGLGWWCCVECVVVVGLGVVGCVDAVCG